MASPKRYRGVTCFVPKGRTGCFLYLVRLVDHPRVLKVGRTSKWSQRSKQYRDWNLRDGDGISEFRLFEINEEWVDLAALEDAVIDAFRLRFPHYKGREWFVCPDIRDAEAMISEMLVREAMCFDVHQMAG